MLADYTFYVYLYRNINTNSRVTDFFVEIFAILYASSLRLCHKVPTKRCSWGCNSDSRYSDREHMQGVKFFPFPKPWIDVESCRKWLRACGRSYEQLNEKKLQDIVMSAQR